MAHKEAKLMNINFASYAFKIQVYPIPILLRQQLLWQLEQQQQ